MTAIKLRIMVRACRIRMEGGEAIEDILTSYTALNDADKAQIRRELSKE